MNKNKCGRRAGIIDVEHGGVEPVVRWVEQNECHVAFTGVESESVRWLLSEFV